MKREMCVYALHVHECMFGMPCIHVNQCCLHGLQVSKVDDSVGPTVAEAAKAMGNGEVCTPSWQRPQYLS